MQGVYVTALYNVATNAVFVILSNSLFRCHRIDGLHLSSTLIPFEVLGFDLL